MFDALLDDFEDDAPRATEDDESFPKIPLRDLDDDDIEESGDDDLEDSLDEGDDAHASRPKSRTRKSYSHRWTRTSLGQTIRCACT